jgi:hypothetical protein
LLHSDHGFALAPYEEITKEEYSKKKNKIKDLNTFIDSGNSMSIEDLECEGGVCPIK